MVDLGVKAFGSDVSMILPFILIAVIAFFVIREI